MAKTTKQKEGSRQLIASDISFLPDTLCNSGNWDLRPTSFRASDVLPLDVAQFNADKGRFEAEDGSGVTEDDIIVQSMVMCLIYRMEKGWGKARSFQALSIWSGKKANANDADDDFPLENLWEEEIKTLIGEKKLGKNTLAHNDNFDNFPRLYGCSKGRWARRATSFIGQVHVFAEQAAVQMALHLHQNVSAGYALLAAFIIHYALECNDEEGDALMYDLSDSLIRSSRKESDNFPKTAYTDIVASERGTGETLPSVASSEETVGSHGAVKSEGVRNHIAVKSEGVVISPERMKDEDIDTDEEGTESGASKTQHVKTEDIDTDEEESWGEMNQSGRSERKRRKVC